MRTFRLLLGLLSTVAIAAMLWYAFQVFGTDPLADKEEYRQYIAQGLKALNASEAGWQTMVIATTRDIDAPRDKVWEEWRKVEKWTEWSAFHLNSFWKGGSEWKVGGKFEQVMRVGWPYETLRAVERIDLVFVPDRAAYIREEGSPSSYTFWRFEFLPGGKTKVTAVEVLHSSEIGFLRPVIEKRWQRDLEKSLNGLVEYVRRAK
jgi:uncharacterized protein YndB with AHSA1/START domain